jgi:hypothetical protein
VSSAINARKIGMVRAIRTGSLRQFVERCSLALLRDVPREYVGDAGGERVAL